MAVAGRRNRCGPAGMMALCRDCLAEAGANAPRRKACGSHRILAHAELAALSIAHLDCDAFYAAIEKRDDPSLASKPVIIGGGKRGVVSTACYVARIRGVRSAMPMFQAHALCPPLTVVATDMAKYVRVGRQVREAMLALTPLVEPLSIDEAFLDLSGTERIHHAIPAIALALLASIAGVCRTSALNGQDHELEQERNNRGKNDRGSSDRDDARCAGTYSVHQRQLTLDAAARELSRGRTSASAVRRQSASEAKLGRWTCCAIKPHPTYPMRTGSAFICLLQRDGPSDRTPGPRFDGCSLSSRCSPGTRSYPTAGKQPRTEELRRYHARISARRRGLGGRHEQWARPSSPSIGHAGP